MSHTTEHIIFKPTGFARQIVTELPIPTSEGLLAALSRSFRYLDMNIPLSYYPAHSLNETQNDNAYLNNDANFKRSGRNLLVTDGQSTYVICCPDWFRVSAFWGPTDDASVLKCIFGDPDQNRDNATFMRTEVHLPSIYALQFTTATDGALIPRFENAYHFTSSLLLHLARFRGDYLSASTEVQDGISRAFRLIPLANTHSDGSLCTGIPRRVHLHSDSGILRTAERLMRAIYCMDNNADMSPHESTTAYLRWTENLEDENVQNGEFVALTDEAIRDTITDFPLISNPPANLEALSETLIKMYTS